MLITDWYLKPYCKTIGSTYSKTVTSESVIYTKSEETNGSTKKTPMTLESMYKNAQRTTELAHWEPILFNSQHNYISLNIMHQVKLVKMKAYAHC